MLDLANSLYSIFIPVGLSEISYFLLKSYEAQHTTGGLIVL